MSGRHRVDTPNKGIAIPASFPAVGQAVVKSAGKSARGCPCEAPDPGGSFPAKTLCTTTAGMSSLRRSARYGDPNRPAPDTDQMIVARKEGFPCHQR